MIITGKQVKAARELLGWSKVKLALQSGVGSFVIDKFERGVRTLHSGSLDGLRRALETSGAEFIGGNPPSVRLRKEE